MKTLSAVAIGLLALVPVRAADGALGTSDVLALSKMTGVCGVMQQMAAFRAAQRCLEAMSSSSAFGQPNSLALEDARTIHKRM